MASIKVGNVGLAWSKHGDCSPTLAIANLALEEKWGAFGNRGVSEIGKVVANKGREVKI